MAMDTEKAMARLAKHDAVRQWDYNPFMHVVRFSTPGLNFLFGNTHGLPVGYPMIMFGPEKAGNTLFCYDLIAQLHRDDPDAIAIRYDTEMKDDAQLTPARARLYGIDTKRYRCYMTKNYDKVFNHIEKEVQGLLQDGANIKLIIIDSLTNILGKRAEAADGMTDKNQIGDASLTHQEGLHRIQEMMHKYRVGFVITTQARAEMDAIEQMRGNTYKMAGGFFLKHLGGYVMQIEPNRGKTGRESLTGEVFEDESLKDGLGKAERTGHKIRARMRGNSYGPVNRSVEVTLSYNEGFINKHEEVFTLGVERGIVSRPTQQKYVLNGYPTEDKNTSWNGKDNFLRALKEDEAIQKAIMERLRGQDIDVMENLHKSKFYVGAEHGEGDSGAEASE